jgi:hypothetical protein
MRILTNGALLHLYGAALHGCDVRCDDRIEDFCRALLHSNHLESLDNLKAAWGTLWACLKSDEG